MIVNLIIIVAIMYQYILNIYLMGLIWQFSHSTKLVFAAS